MSRSGAARTTVGLPGTGLSWALEHGDASSPGLPNSRRLRSSQLESLQRQLLAMLHDQLFPPGSAGHQLWEQGLVSRLLADGSVGGRTAGLLALIETPQAMEAYLLRARTLDDAKRRAHRCIAAVQDVCSLAEARGWRA